MTKRLPAAARAVAFALAGAVLVPLSTTGQEIDVAALQEVDDDRTDVQHNGFTVEQIEDMDLVRDGDVIGEVEEVLADASGEIAALVVELRDGNIRQGDDEVVLPIDGLDFASDRGVVQTTMSDEELAALPGWDD